MTTEFELLADDINKYIVAPVNAFGLGGFVFDIEGETTVNLNTEITDHFLEDNTTVQDHIAVKPKKITLKSYVGELVYREDQSTNTPVQQAVRKLTTVSEYLPLLADGARQITDLRREDVENFSLRENITSKTINKVSDYWSFVKNLQGSNSRQQQAYMYFKALMTQKILVSVQTPFEYMNNMAIESITAIQTEQTNSMSDFSITLKQIRTAEILNVPAGSTRYESNIEPFEKYDGRAVEQNSSLTNQGNVVGYDDLSYDDLINDYDTILRAIES